MVYTPPNLLYEKERALKMEDMVYHQGGKTSVSQLAAQKGHQELQQAPKRTSPDPTVHPN